MKTWIAILFTVALVVACLALSAAINFNLMLILVLATALWVATDSSKLQFRRYKSSISAGPVALFIGCAFLWVVVFPWYLAMRHRIKSGTAVLKDQPTAA